jgi:pilus assembly protein CpaF
MSTTVSSVSAPRPSPLARIEAAAWERATKRQIDVRTAEGAAELRALVTDEALAYSNDSGAAAHDDATQRLVERALRDLAGYGPLEPLLADPDVWEIVVNGADAIFVRRHSQPSTPHSELFLDADHLERTLVRLLDDAGGLGALIREGISQDYSDKIWAGVLAVAFLAILFEQSLRLVTRRLRHETDGSQRIV